MVTPVLVLLFLGAADFARVFHAACVVAGAAHAGALYGAQNASTAADIAGIRSAAQSAAQELSGIDVSATESCQCGSGTPVSCGSGACPATLQIGVNVTAQYTFRTQFPYPGIPRAIALRRSVAIRAK